MTKVYIGVDIAKVSFTSAGWTGQGASPLGTYANTAQGYQDFAARVAKFCHQCQAEEVHLIIEPTGGYEIGLTLFAATQGWLVSRPNPGTLRQWAKGAQRRSKTDALDAKMLAEYGAKMQPKPHAFPAAHARQLDYLLRRRDDLDEVIRGESNRLEVASHVPDMPAAVIENLQLTLTGLQAQRDALQQTIDELVDHDADLHAQRDQLLTLPGIGDKNVLPLLVLLHRFDALTQGAGTHKQLTAFLGLDPKLLQSGTSLYVQAGISKQGDCHGRALLYMGALGGIRGHNVLRAYYELMLSRGKPKKVALIACARKILVWAWSLWTSNTTFDPTRFPHLLEQCA